MGVEQNTYVIYGIKMPYIQFKTDDQYYLLDDHDADSNVTILHDGMDCEYTIIGHIIAKSGYGGFDRVLCLDDYSDYVSNETMGEINELVSIFSKLIDSDDYIWENHPRTYIVTHYT